LGHDSLKTAQMNLATPEGRSAPPKVRANRSPSRIAWSPTITSRYRAGETMTAIATDLGRSPEFVKAVLVDAGVVLRTATQQHQCRRSRNSQGLGSSNSPERGPLVLFYLIVGAFVELVRPGRLLGR
jgi:hypothetical protein